MECLIYNIARISLLSKLKYIGMKMEDLLTVYKTFIRCIVEYCCVVWHSSLFPWTGTESLPKNYSRQRFCWIYKCIGVLWTGDPGVKKGQAILLSFAAKKCIKSSKHRHMNINYATRSSTMLIMPGQKNIVNLLLLISRDCWTDNLFVS